MGLRLGAGDNHGIETSVPPDAAEPALAADSESWAYRVACWIVPRQNPARVVYGLLTVGALMAAESGHHETYLDLIVSALITTFLYWLLHAYSSVLGHRLATGEHLTLSTLSHGLMEEWAIVRGAAIPLLALIIAWLAGAGQETGVTVALYSAVASLIAFELAAGIRSRAAPRELALEVGIGAVMGLAILGLRILLH
jgi:hypothetical protein